MKLAFEYGQGLMSAELPDSTDIFIPGETVADPPCLPQDWDSLYNATLQSIRNPIGMEPLKELAAPGKTVVFVIPDIVKGGNQPTSHRKVAIRACLDELYAAGVEKKDILLLFSNGLHPRATVPEMRTILGEELFNEFYPSGQITSHDSEDYDHLVDLGYTAQGDHVIMNKYVFDADIAILIGHTQGNPYGGYSGGYKHCATGISHWRSIAAHHVPQVMHRPDFVPVSTNSEMRHKFDQQGMLMEEKMGKKFFCCDAVLDTKSRQIEIHSGWAKEMQPISWKMADKRTYVHWAEKKYDIIVFGMPTNFHYGNGMGTNPIQMMQALSAQVIRHKRIMSDHCVFIVSSICDGYFHDERWPYLRELYDMFQHDYILIGDEARITELLAEYGCEKSAVTIYHEPDQKAAVQKAIDLIHAGQADCIMKGLIKTAQFMHAILKRENDLRTENLVSMLSIRELPHYHKLIAFTDAGICMNTTLDEKRQIIENAVRTMTAMGYENIKVGVLASVEVVNPRMKDSVEAAELKRMNQEGIITGCTVEGPISYDVAINKEAAQIKGFGGEVAGDADLLVFPELTSANLTTKAITQTCRIPVGSLILGTKVPVILSSRASSAETKYMCIALAAAVNTGDND